MQGSVKYTDNTQRLATQEQLETRMAHEHHERIFDTRSFSYRSCVESKPEDEFSELAGIAARMNYKIEARDQYLSQAVLAGQKSSYENYLCKLRGVTSCHSVIEPFDFNTIKPANATIVELYKENSSAKASEWDYAVLTTKKKTMFLKRMASLDFEKDTRLSFD